MANCYMHREREATEVIYRKQDGVPFDVCKECHDNHWKWRAGRN